MILRPCKKCLVKTVCEDPCPQIRRRKRYCDQIELFSSVSALSGFFILMLALAIFKNSQFDEYLNFIAMLIVSYMLLAGIFGVCWMKILVNKAVQKFEELGRTRVPPVGVPPSPGFKAPPPPPPKRYVKP